MIGSKKLIVLAMIVAGLGVTSAVLGTWVQYSEIDAVEITSHSDGDIVFAGGEYTLTCTRSRDFDALDSCESQGVIDGSVTHTWSGPGSFSPTTGLSVAWTAPTATGTATITVTADDLNTVKFDDTGTTDSIDFTVTNVIYVDLDKTSGNNDGTSWANAFLSLQDALAAADDAGVSANEIWVAEGTYFPDDGTDRTKSFELVDGIDVYGGFEGIAAEDERGDRDWFANETILSGDIDDDGSLDSDNSIHVVIGGDDVVLDGLTITGGFADGTSGDEHNGGGIYNYDVSLTVSNCIFRGNFANYKGGGMMILTTESFGADVIISNCLFYDNEADYGGGAFVQDYSVNRFENCTFTDNVANNYGGGICSYQSDCETEIVNSIMYGNEAQDYADVFANFDSVVTMSYSDVGEYGYLNGGSFSNSNLLDTDPLFYDSGNDDYHLKSSGGRYGSSGWDYNDIVDSPCIDTGDNVAPSPYSNEPAPNGSRVNMGYYGNTAEASKTP